MNVSLKFWQLDIISCDSTSAGHSWGCHSPKSIHTSQGNNNMLAPWCNTIKPHRGHKSPMREQVTFLLRGRTIYDGQLNRARKPSTPPPFLHSPLPTAPLLLSLQWMNQAACQVGFLQHAVDEHHPQKSATSKHGGFICLHVGKITDCIWTMLLFKALRGVGFRLTLGD